MPGGGDFTDCRDDLLVIDDAPAVLSREGVGRHQIDRDADALRVLALTRADPDAGHQDEPAHRDSVAGIRYRRRGTAGGRGLLDHHPSTMPEPSRSPQCVRATGVLSCRSSWVRGGNGFLL